MCKWMLWIYIFNLLAFASRVLVYSFSCIFSWIENSTKEETAKFPCRFFDKVLKICRIQKAISRRNMHRIPFQGHLFKACFVAFFLCRNHFCQWVFCGTSRFGLPLFRQWNMSPSWAWGKAQRTVVDTKTAGFFNLLWVKNIFLLYSVQTLQRITCVNFHLRNSLS